MPGGQRRVSVAVGNIDRTAEETEDNKNAHDFQNNAFVRSLMLFTGSP